MKTHRRSRKADVVLSVIVLLLVTFGAFVGWEQLQNRRMIAQYAVDQSNSMPAFEQNIGNPTHMGWFVSGIVIGSYALHPRIADAGTADLTIPVQGPRGRGSLVVWMQEGFAGQHICSMDLVMSEGKKIVLVPDEQSHCERE
jgi:hypothetical protein